MAFGMLVPLSAMAGNTSAGTAYPKAHPGGRRSGIPRLDLVGLEELLGFLAVKAPPCRDRAGMVVLSYHLLT